MSDPVKITRFEAENVKRVKAVALEPTPAGLTIVGGKNGQGKTSVLDAIAWALGGDRFKPSQPHREGSATPAHLSVTLSNGLVVERKGPNSALKVIDPQGNKAGQTLLSEFVEAFALDLPRFMQSSGKEKAQTVLRIIGVGEKLFELEQAEERLYSERHAVGQIAEQKKNAATEMPSHPDAPAEPVSASELIRQQQEILARNGENQRLREQASELQRKERSLASHIDLMKHDLEAAEADYQKLLADMVTAMKTAEQLTDESTAELEASIAAVDEINAKVRDNQAKSLLEDEAATYKGQYDELTGRIEAVRAEKVALLDGADLPLPGLSVDAGELTYNGHAWDAMSGSEQLRVATAIVRKLNPDCGFVLLDKLEQMDLDTLNEFGAWLTEQGLQVIATRVSTGDECSIVIEDGYAVTSEAPASNGPAWKEGQF
jgi:DNA repair exonuclease SbcCD ATPase subunit